MSHRPIKPLFLLGATAVGKSATAVEWIRSDPQLAGAAILCLDAMQVYREADIGTGKPSAVEQKEIPHGGLDLVDFGAPFDVAQYLAHAKEFLNRQRAANRPVLAVGGTGLYFRALTQGLCDAPRGSLELRAELAALSVAELHARLTRVDPDILARLDAANPRRLARAIEVMETTGRSLSAWRQEMTSPPVVTDYTAYWLQRDLAGLRQRIEERIAAMFAAGWIEEVRRLIARHGADHVRAFPAIGYRQIAGLLAGQMSEADARGDILVATRQYAKRQLTWFAREPKLKMMMLPCPPTVPGVP